MSDTTAPEPFAALRRALSNASPPLRRLMLIGVIALSILVSGTTLFAPKAAQAANHTIAIKNFAFTPDVLTLAPGDTVTFVNQETDGTVHAIRGDFTSPDLPPGATFTVTIVAAGSYNYYCSFHPYMTGIINAGTASPSPSRSPSASPSPSPSRSPSGSPSPGVSPGVSPSPSVTPTTPTPGSAPCDDPVLGADQGDGTRLAAYEVVGSVKVFKLCMSQTDWEVSPGVVKLAYTFNGIVPGPTIKVNEGDKVRVIVQNDLPEHTAVHWHGMVLPNAQDGVPDITQPHILPGETYTYEWTAKSTGTHWYHSHMGGGQVGRGLYGALLVTPTLGDIAADKHYTIQIGDGSNGFTFNGKSYPATAPLAAAVNQKVHIRLIGAGPEMIHPIHLHGAAFQVVAQDGNKLASPYTVDTLNVGVGQTYDIVFQPKEPGKWLLHCHIFSHSEGPNGMIGLVTIVNVTA
ncbi:multicopper oxidase domain-containing protein [Microbispora hainanensis]|uniref:Multicopper oxidase domain-containing protein n=1 Tax=Microbispora hainanensis TaxID=568844 RepID=A0ABZ1SN79_9ACTN|nr:multicopper oxidase domain-containing protein [Microbispora hainanensis]